MTPQELIFGELCKLHAINSCVHNLSDRLPYCYVPWQSQRLTELDIWISTLTDKYWHISNSLVSDDEPRLELLSHKTYTFIRATEHAATDWCCNTCNKDTSLSNRIRYGHDYLYEGIRKLIDWNTVKTTYKTMSSTPDWIDLEMWEYLHEQGTCSYNNNRKFIYVTGCPNCS